MLQTMRSLGVIAKISMLEGARKQIFHVLMLFSLTLIVVSTLLGFFDHNIQIKIVKDLVSVAMMISIGLIAITLSVSGLPMEIENKTAYPVLAKPISRWQFVLGKYLGIMGTITIGMLIMTAAFAAILLVYAHAIDGAIMLLVPFLLLEAAILAAVGSFLSTLCSPPLAWFLTLFAYILGSAKVSIYHFLTGGHNVFERIIGTILYHALPNLECFNFKDSLVHHIPVPPGYLVQTALYGLTYTAAVLVLTSISFADKEL